MGAFNANILPASTGLALGTQNQSWTAYLDNLFLYDSGGNLVHNLRTDGTASTLGGPFTLNGTLTGRNAIFNSSALGSPIIQGYDHSSVLVLQASESGSGGIIFSLFDSAGALLHSLRTDTGTNQIGNNLTVGGNLQATDLSVSADASIAGDLDVSGAITVGSFTSNLISEVPGSFGIGNGVAITAGNGASSGGSITLTPGQKIIGGGFLGSIDCDGPVNFNNGIGYVGTVQTTGHGLAAECAIVDLTAQTAAITTSTLYAVPSTGAGQYRVSWNAKITTAGSSSSTLGDLTIIYTDPDGVAVTLTCGAMIAAGTIATTSTANTTGTVLVGLPLLLNCKLSTNITYAMAYASSSANSMAYNLHIVVEAM